mmetsp:Transcript_19495/g.24075  ORF Transcript_19495/g.24075 Transcript_19495/m.24075 type:complete len:138 (+) Transcript_19495:1116-1529(+)
MANIRRLDIGHKKLRKSKASEQVLVQCSTFEDEPSRMRSKMSLNLLPLPMVHNFSIMPQKQSSIWNPKGDLQVMLKRSASFGTVFVRASKLSLVKALSNSSQTQTLSKDTRTAGDRSLVPFRNKVEQLRQELLSLTP